ncbi:DUF3748 domain-containing protein [Algoriphagus yeomjeoni]|uniref:WD40 repeat protein n=1 Tax=Algoriphagus yeomjeoni TaxID=291403 RepID=A0A327NYZ5_9BACT|nr:DUF3748 domain-containing protein [Algoriphagus yeomjeoni]RAI83852.1 WD40 repeat protein [Algoriphagus yeomjeoni]
MTENKPELQETQVTFGPAGHMLNQRQAFSPDDNFLVFDSRNDDSKIGENPSIGLVNLETKELKTIYDLENQTSYGPGVGAVSFHPSQNEVVFIHGLKNASAAQPYTFTRRFAMKVDLDKPELSGPMEARDINPPFTKGALRGGSHAYSYNSDGAMLSFTYNDELLEIESKSNPEVHDLRTVGALLIGEEVAIEGTKNEENFDGLSFAILLAKVIANPKPGSDEINKAYEECWVGNAGYKKPDGTVQKHALAFLGDVVSKSGKKVTEVFLTDIPEDILALKASVSAGTNSSLPSLPHGITQRRLTYTADDLNPGIQGPRQWLRSSPDGNSIYFYKEDDSGTVQIYAVSPNGGEIKQITKNDFSPDTTFGLSADGKYIAYSAEEAIFVTSVDDGETQLVLPRPTSSSSQLSNINWANGKYTIAYNRKIELNGATYYQIFTLDLSKILG